MKEARPDLAVWPGAAVVLGGALLLGTISGLRIHLSYHAVGRSISLGDALVTGWIDWGLWGLLFPVVLWIAQRTTSTSMARPTAIAMLLGGSVVVSFVHAAAFAAVTTVVRVIRFGGGDFLGRELPPALLQNFPSDLLIYWAMIFALRVVHAKAREREDALRVSRLERAVAEQRLDMLSAHLRPHFLFNTLNTISALLRRDPDAAERMLARLAELLRESLRLRDRPTISLAEELDLVRAYLELQAIRFGERLRPDVRVDSSAVDASVPSFLLQPLVENAVVHGVARVAEPCRVEVRAERSADRLRLEVRDTGPGQAAAGSRSNGTGLRTTRERLDLLYPGDHHLRVDEREGSRDPGRRRSPVRGARMTRLRCLVVDDEPHARQRMVDLLADEHDVDVVACCADGRDAIERIADLQPDLVFLDIEMPGADGFAVVEAIPAGQLPEVVFVTAYDEFAVRAFEVNAVDYLLKPVDRARFARCVARCRARLASQARPSHEQLSSLLRFRRDPDAPAARVVARRGDDVHFHDPDQIDWVEAAGNYLRVHVGDEVSLVRDTMARMHRRLRITASFASTARRW